MIERIEAIIFHEDVPPIQTKTLEHVIKSNARIKEINVKIINGPDGDLRIYLRHFNVSGDELPLIDYVGSKKYISGNNTEYTFKVDVPACEKDKIQVLAQNLDSQYTYPCIVDMSIEYEKKEV